MLEDPHDTKGRETRQTAQVLIGVIRQSLLDCPITISITPSANEFKEQMQRASYTRKGLLPA